LEIGTPQQNFGGGRNAIKAERGKRQKRNATKAERGRLSGELY